MATATRSRKKESAPKITTNVDAKKVKKDDLMAFIFWAKVNYNTNGDQLDVSDLDRTTNFKVNGKDLIENASSADQYGSTKRSTKTKVAEILVTSYNRPFTVCFEKTDGTERVLRGRLVNPEPLLGRSMVDDLDLPLGEHRLRQVDHRTIKWLIIDNVKYTVR